MNKDIGVSTDGGREVGVKRDIQGVVAVLGDIEHTSTEVLGTLKSLEGNQFEKLASSGVLDSFE